MVDSKFKAKRSKAKHLVTIIAFMDVQFQVQRHSIQDKQLRTDAEQLNLEQNKKM